MRRLVFLTVPLACLAAASPAAAKEVQSVRVCGAGDCAQHPTQPAWCAG